MLLKLTRLLEKAIGSLQDYVDIADWIDMYIADKLYIYG